MAAMVKRKGPPEAFLPSKYLAFIPEPELAAKGPFGSLE